MKKRVQRNKNKGTVVNLALSSLHGGSIKIKLTILLTIILQKKEALLGARQNFNWTCDELWLNAVKQFILIKQGFKTTVSGPRFQDQGFRTTVSGPRFQDHGFRTTVSGPWFQNHYFRTTVSGPGFQDLGFRTTVSEPRSRTKNTN